MSLALLATCLDACGVLATGRTTDAPTERRRESRWAELDGLAEKHTHDTGHATRVGATTTERTSQ